MTKVYLLLFPPLILLFGCTKNNQNSPANFAYLNINQQFAANNCEPQAYDIDNDGVVDWGFYFCDSGNPTYLFGLRGDPEPPGYTGWLVDTALGCCTVKPLLSGFNINNLCLWKLSNQVCLFADVGYNNDICGTSKNISLKGSGDFYIGFKSRNSQLTNTFFGWARLNLSADGKTLIVKDMALNTVNGGSINVGQH